MKSIVNYILFLGFILLFNPLLAQQDTINSSYSLSGKIIDPKTKKGVANAHIIIGDTRMGKICDSLGFFHLKVTPLKKLHISAIGFRDTIYTVESSPNLDASFIEIPLHRESYLLEEVMVHSLGTWEQFKYTFIHTKPPEKSECGSGGWKLPNLTKEYQTALAMRRPGAGISAGIFGPSRRDKSRLKLAKFEYQEANNRLLDKKFNKDIVKQLTGEVGKRLDALMAFINDRRIFTYQSNEYYIGKKIKEYHCDFLKTFPASSGNYALTDSLQNIKPDSCNVQ